MKNEIEAMITDITTTTAEAEDYTGEDGLLYCGKCHTPKEAYFAEGKTCFGRDRHPAECDCQRAAREKQQAAESRQKHLETVGDLKRRGFTDPAMRNWTFEHDNGRNPQTETARFYVESWETMQAENIGYLFWGGVGTGKSYLAACIANALMEKEVAVCMEFPNLGEYHDNLSLEEAVRIYQEIPAERMNGIKGIGFELKDGSDYEGPFPILTGQTIDLDTIQAIDYYRDNPLVQKAVKELAATMSEMEVLGADANQQEALFLINDTTYLHIQPCDSGWDYTLYDAASMKELDGGQLDMSELSCMKAVLQICDDNDLDSTSLRRAPLFMVETLQEAAYQQMQAEASQMTASSQLPEAQEQALDEYPMPDEQVSTPDMQEYGYSYDGMLPVTRERALELDAAGLTVYVLHEDNTESMVFDSQEIMDHGGLFGVDREEWEKSPQFHEKVMERQEHQQEREQAFLAQNRDCFAIYQVSRDDPQDVRFMNLDWLKSHDISIDRSNYDLIYTAPLRESGTVPEQLEKLYEQFNLQKPADFHSPSMSVSDIVAIKQDGKVSCHYCDSVGFTQIPGFLPENPLKNAEMAVEDDYGMIDGIINNGTKEPTVAELEQQARSGQPISLMDLAAATQREEREKKKSVVNQLKSQPKAEHKKTAQKKSAEREI